MRRSDFYIIDSRSFDFYTVVCVYISTAVYILSELLFAGLRAYVYDAATMSIVYSVGCYFWAMTAGAVLQMIFGKLMGRIIRGIFRKIIVFVDQGFEACFDGSFFI